jgi:dipeptidyl aminopeptidase/acylaminoacyl peptidase
MLGGAPWDAREAYTEYSPIFNLDRIKTPLMIIHSRGDGDYGVPQWGVDGVFVGLRYLNRTVTMLLYDGGHGTAMFSYPDRVDCWIRQIAWYDRFLK